MPRLSVPNLIKFSSPMGPWNDLLITSKVMEYSTTSRKLEHAGLMGNLTDYSNFIKVSTLLYQAACIPEVGGKPKYEPSGLSINSSRYI